MYDYYDLIEDSGTNVATQAAKGSKALSATDLIDKSWKITKVRPFVVRAWPPINPVTFFSTIR